MTPSAIMEAVTEPPCAEESTSRPPTTTSGDSASPPRPPATARRAMVVLTVAVVAITILWALAAGRFDHVPLLVPALAPTIEVAAVLALAGSWASRRRRRLAVALPAVVLASAALTGLAAAALRLTGTVVDPYPASFALWVGAALAALIGFPVVATTSGPATPGLLRRCAAVAAVPLTLTGALLLINDQYGVWPTVGDLLGHTGMVDGRVLGGRIHRDAARRDRLRGNRLRVDRFQGDRFHGDGDDGADDAGVQPLAPPGSLDTGKGVLVALDPPATRSHFVHRPGSVYLPPAYFTPARARLPVVVMLAGAPGSPVQWPTSGRATATADAYAVAHHGWAPILLFVDQNGSTTGDTECVDGPQGRAETYLTVDVPAFVTGTLGVPQVAGRWGVAGFSAGGTCALDLALGHPDIFRHFVDLAGDQWPNLGNRDHTRWALFGGSRAAMEAHDPARLLLSHRYPGMTGWFAAGINDPDKLAVVRKLAGAAARGGLKVYQFTGVAGHNWQFASDAFARVLPQLSTDAGLR